ncbi:MAG: glutathione S-transferase N-terminal domain-containing protein [Candidatus Pacebacteria bacterium]|nr:glutathione S-transferase N-terminal domain-containing protein [Candidatus Paceibacterota bacterium]
MEKINKKVKVYSTPDCAYCWTLKGLLKKYDIEFEEIDVFGNQDAKEEMIKKSGQKEVPVLEFGDQIIVGYDKKKILEVLGIK